MVRPSVVLNKEVHSLKLAADQGLLLPTAITVFVCQMAKSFSGIGKVLTG
jgi:hypothetical protein